MLIDLGALVLLAVLVALLWPARLRTRFSLLPVQILIVTEFLSWTFGAGTLVLPVGPINVGITDVAIVAIWLDLLRRWSRKLERASLLMLVLGALVAMSIARTSSGFETTVNMSRLSLATYGGLIEGMFLARQEDPLRVVRMVIVWPAFAALVLGLIRILTSGLGTIGSGRALVSAPALAVGMGAVFAAGMVAFSPSIGRRRWLMLMVPALLVVMLSQQRTVWIATALGLAVLLVSHRGGLRFSSRLRLGSLIAFLVLTLGGIGSLVADDVSTRLAQAAQNPDLDSSTLAWRVESGDQLLREFASLSWGDKLIGVPVDAVFERTIGDNTWTVNPHNQYIHILLYAGAAGLAILVAVLWSALRCNGLGTVLGTMVAMAVLYGFGYQYTPLAALVVGLAANWPKDAGLTAADIGPPRSPIKVRRPDDGIEEPECPVIAESACGST
ncbi:MAG: O-antigen ligase family protein [bacterium]|nr:O-antigen ligase family protein [bacterium]